MKNRKSTLTAIIVAFVFGAAVVSTAYAACNTTGASACRKAYFQCIRSTGGDPEGTCEGEYNQCLMSNGCPIP